MKKRMTGWLVGIVVGAMFLGACGGDDSPDEESPAGEQTSPAEEETSPAPEGGGSQADIESCLADAGIELATGQTPTISGVEGIGIEPGEGPLQPGNITAAVFVYPSEGDAQAAETSLQGAAFPELDQNGNILVVYAVAPSPQLQSAVDGCI